MFQNSQILQVTSQYSILSSSLLKILDKKTVGYLEPVTESPDLTPLIVITTLNNAGNTVLVAFCVDDTEDPGHAKLNTYNTFNKLFRENIKYNIVKNMVEEIFDNTSGEAASTNISSPTVDSQTIALLKEKVQEILPNTKLKPSFSSVVLRVTNVAVWETFFKEKKLVSDAVFARDETCDKELLLFSVNHAVIKQLEPDQEISADMIIEEIIKKRLTDDDSEVVFRTIENLSNLEQYFFRMGSDEIVDILMIEAGVMTSLFEQFEKKHQCKIMIVNKPEKNYVYCSVEPRDTWNRVEKGEEERKESAADPRNKIKPSPVRKHHNPDEIIDGRPKWSEIKVMREENKFNKDDFQSEEILDFDRLNPHRSFVAEFEDEFDNIDWRYNHTVLKMMADLNSETVVALGDKKLDPEAEKKYMEEYQSWQRYKRENQHSYPHVRLKRLKADKMVKVKQYKIIAKNLRKSSVHCNSLYI